MRVLITTSSMHVGGAERFVVQLASGLVERGHTVGLAACPGLLDAELVDVPHARYFVPLSRRSAVRIAQVLMSIRRALKRFEPDIVHSQNVLNAALAGVAIRSIPRGSVPVLATFHGVTPSEYGTAARLLRAVDAVACVSDDLLDELVAAGYPAARTHLVRNAVDAPTPLTPERIAALDDDLNLRPAGSTARPRVVAIVGRLVPQKDHDLFLRCAAWVASRLPDTRFLVVGDGPLRQDLESLAGQLGIAEKVAFTLMRDDARDIIARADVLVFSSRWEGLSITALEAVACGTPIISTDTQGMRWLLRTGAGDIVNSSPDSLGRAIIALLQDDDRRGAMGEAGRQLAAGEFRVPDMVDKYCRLYSSLTSACENQGVQRS